MMAAGANIATTLATFSSFAYLFIYYKTKRKEIGNKLVILLWIPIIFLILLTLIFGNSYASVIVSTRIFGVPYNVFRNFSWLSIFGLIVALMVVIKFIKDKSSLKYKIRVGFLKSHSYFIIHLFPLQ